MASPITLSEFRDQVSLLSDNQLLDDKDNLDLKINYFLGGPGEKISAVKSSEREHIIPYDDV